MKVLKSESILWDMLAFGAVAAAMYFLSDHASQVEPLIMFLGVGPSIAAMIALWRRGLNKDAIGAILLSAAALLAVGLLLGISGGVYSSAFHPEEVLCGTYGCAWNPAGTSAALFVGGMGVMLLAILMGVVAAGIAGAIVAVKTHAFPDR